MKLQPQGSCKHSLFYTNFYVCQAFLVRQMLPYLNKYLKVLYSRGVYQPCVKTDQTVSYVLRF